MSRKSQSSSARSSRFGVRGLGFQKSPTAAQAETDDWYIPYNGPYEVPKDYLRNEHHHHDNRKDALYKVEDTVFGHKRELHFRSGIEGRKRQERGGWSSEPEERKVRNKLRAPPNSARAAQRRSTHTSSNLIHYTPTSTFSSGGGIGESPMPIQRQLLLNPSVAPSNRLSLANFLSFGAKKTTVQWPSPLREYDDPAGDLFAPRFNQPTRRKRTSQDEARPLLKAVSIEHLSTRHSALTDDEDLYSPLASHPKRDHTFRPQYFGDFAPRSASKTQPHGNAANPILEDESEQSPPPTVTITTSPNPRPHPYAYVFPSAALSIDAPRSAPPAPHAILPPQKHKVLCSSSDDNHASTSRPTAIPEHLKPHSHSRGPLLKGSISTPNLRGPAKDPSQHSVPRGKDRWLSAETWCDALLFPRPRFKIKHGGSSPGSDDEKRSSGTTSKGSGRIVSPPETPISRMDFDTSADLYSWTMKKDAIPASVAPPRPNRPRGLTLPTMTRPPTPPVTRDLGVEVQEIRIPKKPAKDDMSLPSPVPSLNRVLEEGDDLDKQRDAWRQQAQQSFQNKRTRSLSRSRSRSKSLTHSSSHRRRKDAENAKPMGSIDFLAARSLLGTQSIAPTITSPHPIEPHHAHTTSVTGTASGHSQSHGTHSHTNSKSSNTNRGHSRNPSWQKSALRVAKSAGALCGLADEGNTPIDETAANLERALSSNDTKRVRMAEPTEEPWGERENATAIIGRSSPEAGITAASPTPSGATGEVEGVGIAVTSEDTNMDELRMPDHPYGAGVYSPTHTTQDAAGHRRLRSADYAGPHPTTSKIAPVITVSDVSTRHRHPYAQQSSSPPINEAGIQPQIRNDSAISPASKMWAQLFPGEVQEILPEEIVYSPDLRNAENATPADDGHSAGDSTLPTDDETRPTHAYVLPDPNRNTRLGVVEALTSAFQSQGGEESGDEEEFMAARRNDDDRTERTETARDRAFASTINSENSSDSLSRAQPIRRKPIHMQSQPSYTQSSTPPEENSFVSSELLSAPAVSRDPSSNAESSSGSSPRIQSQGSSPPVSPQPLGSVDDLDHFRDLFYRPDQSGTNASPSPEMSGESFISERVASGISWSSHGNRTASGLTSLARQLSQELEELSAQERLAEQLESENHNSGQRLVEFREQQPLNVSTDLHFVLSEGSISHSPMGESSTLRLDNEQSDQAPSVNIPEDVESSRASSLLEPSSHRDDEGDTFGLVRVGLVGAVNTPATVEVDHRASGHISLIDEDTRRRGDPLAQLRALSHSSSLQPWSADYTRSSYMTTDTGASRISGLSDFPDPPISDMTPAHMSVLASYFSGIPPEEEQHTENPPDSPTEPAPSEPPSTKFSLRRMTFGGDEDIEKLADDPGPPEA